MIDCEGVIIAVSQTVDVRSEHTVVITGPGADGKPVSQCMGCCRWARGDDAQALLATVPCNPDDDSTESVEVTSSN